MSSIDTCLWPLLRCTQTWSGSSGKPSMCIPRSQSSRSKCPLRRRSMPSKSALISPRCVRNSAVCCKHSEAPWKASVCLWASLVLDRKAPDNVNIAVLHLIAGISSSLETSAAASTNANLAALIVMSVWWARYWTTRWLTLQLLHVCLVLSSILCAHSFSCLACRHWSLSAPDLSRRSRTFTRPGFFASCALPTTTAAAADLLRWALLCSTFKSNNTVSASWSTAFTASFVVR
mmetsp:Transcript_94210/g.239752  ORF Transcript_94210/g.239752 Transcript_94210/m.239752 type:complete len:233 (-) Transcript_94210:514-1212(-)